MGICGARAEHCFCELPTGHPEPHHCVRDNCGGQWRGDYDADTFDVVRLPSVPIVELVNHLTKLAYGSQARTVYDDAVAAGVSHDQVTADALKVYRKGGA